MTIWWPRSGVWIYQIVTGVTSVVGVPSTHLVKEWDMSNSVSHHRERAGCRIVVLSLFYENYHVVMWNGCNWLRYRRGSVNNAASLMPSSKSETVTGEWMMSDRVLSISAHLNAIAYLILFDFRLILFYQVPLMISQPWFRQCLNAF